MFTLTKRKEKNEDFSITYTLKVYILDWFGATFLACSKCSIVE